MSTKEMNKKTENIENIETTIIPLQEMMNDFYIKGNYIPMWEEAHLTLIYKKGHDPELQQSYMPISYRPNTKTKATTIPSGNTKHWNTNRLNARTGHHAQKP
uniref:Uncharacterized protein n=1 Tax=Sphaerodactylus townsendi TaxID=933632 RepID=A0ACB8FCE6_9SAUR